MSNPDESHAGIETRLKQTARMQQVSLPKSQLPGTELGLWRWIAGGFLALVVSGFGSQFMPLIETQLTDYVSHPGGGVQTTVMVLVVSGLMYIGAALQMLVGRYDRRSVDTAAALSKIIKGQRDVEVEMAELKETLETLNEHAKAASDSGEVRADFLQKLVILAEAEAKRQRVVTRSTD